MSLFDICPDLEELIVDELKVLTKYRGAVKEFKTRMLLGKKALAINSRKKNKHNDSRVRGPKITYGIPRNIIHTLFPHYGRQDNNWGHYCKNGMMKYKELANIHGFLYDPFGTHVGYGDTWYTNYAGPHSPGVMTVENINKVLTELGATKFKSKKKSDKIKLLMKY